MTTATAERQQNKVTIPVLKPYYWQIPSFNMIRDGYKRGIWVDHRRCGKDARSFNMTIEEMWNEPGLVSLMPICLRDCCTVNRITQI